MATTLEPGPAGTIPVKSATLGLLFLLGVALAGLPSAQALMLHPTCHGIVGLAAGEGACQSGCSGAATVAVGDGNCHGGAGQDGCSSRLGSVIVGSGNCHGGDGEDGGDGGDGCDDVLLIVGDQNCHGGDGDDG